MEEHINLLTDKYDLNQTAVSDISARLRTLSTDVTALQLRKDLQKEFHRLQEKVDSSRQTVGDYRLKISIRETELLLAFRELIACDIWVADTYFANYHATRQAMPRQEQFEIDLKTFWLPVELEAEHVEKDMSNARYTKKVGALHVDANNYGSFLAGPIRERVLQEKRDRIATLAKGTDVSNLHAPDLAERAAKLAFDRFSSKGEAKQSVKLGEQKRVIEAKTSKKDYVPDMPF